MIYKNQLYNIIIKLFINNDKIKKIHINKLLLNIIYILFFEY